MLVECHNCSAIVDGEKVASYTHYEESSDITGIYSFLKCPRCGSPFITLQTSDAPEFDNWDPPKMIFPPEIQLTSVSVPVAIAIAYNEARVCFRAKTYTAAAIMCRKTLEGIAEAHQIKSRNLASALREMQKQGLIENRLYEWADALRISGNEAAHGVSTTVSAQDAKDILDFTNALLEYVFTFRDKFEKWKARRAAKGEPTADPSPAPDEDE